MNRIDQYLRPATLEEAYEAVQRKNSAVLGGMLWLRLGSRHITTAIDLSALGLNRIEETKDRFLLGAYVTLRQMETDPSLNAWSGGVFAKAFAPIVGVQFRNMATVGGSVFGRFGFSDVITALLAVNASVHLYKTGTVPLADFLSMGQVRDILTHVSIPKEPCILSYQAQRSAATDLPVLNVCAALSAQQLTVTVGARPLQARRFCFDAADLSRPEEIAGRVAAETVFASNTRASAEYRRHLCRVLVRRALDEIFAEKENG